MTEYSGQLAVVTGGASGLGAATAKVLAAKGLRVAVFDLDEERGNALAQEAGLLYFNVDVADPASVAQGLKRATSEGSLRAMINCAGIGPAAKTVSRGAAHDPALFMRAISVNLVGTFNCASQAAAIMAAQNPEGSDGARGVIVNTASVAAYDGQIGQIAYAASKGGIVGMTLPMARDLADKGIRVCTIAPGLFLTPLLQSLPAEAQDSLGRQVPFPSRLGNPSEFAALVLHIMENPMLNGEVIRLDGAIRMAPR